MAVEGVLPEGAGDLVTGGVGADPEACVVVLHAPLACLLGRGGGELVLGGNTTGWCGRTGQLRNVILSVNGP